MNLEIQQDDSPKKINRMQRHGVVFSARVNTDEERLKTDADERLKTEERQFINPEINLKFKQNEQKASKTWGKTMKSLFGSIFKRNKSENFSQKPSTSPKRSIMKSFFIQRKKEKTEKTWMNFEKSQPTQERIKYLWGVARKKVFYAIKFVEGLIDICFR